SAECAIQLRPGQPIFALGFDVLALRADFTLLRLDELVHANEHPVELELRLFHDAGAAGQDNVMVGVHHLARCTEAIACGAHLGSDADRECVASVLGLLDLRLRARHRCLPAIEQWKSKLDGRSGGPGPLRLTLEVRARAKLRELREPGERNRPRQRLDFRLRRRQIEALEYGRTLDGVERRLFGRQTRKLAGNYPRGPLAPDAHRPVEAFPRDERFGPTPRELDLGLLVDGLLVLEVKIRYIPDGVLPLSQIGARLRRLDRPLPQPLNLVPGLHAVEGGPGLRHERGRRVRGSQRGLTQGAAGGASTSRREQERGEIRHDDDLPRTASAAAEADLA